MFSPYKGDRVIIYIVNKEILLIKKETQSKSGQRIRTNNSQIIKKEQMFNLTGNHENAS